MSDAISVSGLRKSFGRTSARRLQRGLLFGWAAGFAVAGLLFGNIAPQVGDFSDSSDAAVTAMRLRAEESALHTEQLLALAVGRTRWMDERVTSVRSGPVLAGAADFSWTPVLALTLVAAALTTAGLTAFRQRDIG